MSSVVNWVKRHRRKFLLGGALVGGIYVVGKVAEWHLARTQELEAKKVVEKVRKQSHFAAAENTCIHTLEALFPTLKRAVETQLDSERVTAVLKNKPPPVEKLQLWEELKVISFSRCFFLVVGGVFLSVMIRVQLNILAGYLYVQEIDGQPQSLNNNREHKPNISVTVQEKFLNICTYFVSEGVEKLCVVVSECIERVTKHLSLKQNMRLEDIDSTFNQIYEEFVDLSGDNNIFTSPGTYFLPEDDDNFFTDVTASDQDLLKQMLADTLDVVENEDTQSLTKQVCKQGLSHLLDCLAEHYASVDCNNPECSDEMTGPPVMNKTMLHETGLPLAKLIPVLRGLASNPDLWLLHLQDNPGTKLLGANVYEAFCQQKQQQDVEGWGDFLRRSASSWF